MIVETTAISCNTGGVATGGGKSDIAKFYEQYCTAALAAAQAKGVSEPEALREVILKARDEAKAIVAEKLKELSEG